MILESHLLDDLLSVKSTLGKIPTLKEYDMAGKFNSDTFSRRFGSWNNALMKCFNKVINKRGLPQQEHDCEFCNKITKNPKYCSQSCAAKANNKKYPKRKPECFCPDCGKRTKRREGICKKCSREKKVLFFGEKTILEFKSVYARHKYQGIRHHAHRISKLYNLNRSCAKCGYTLHTELCHKKPISKFDKKTKIKIVNSVDNLVYLCPTHHWELENDILKL